MKPLRSAAVFSAAVAVLLFSSLASAQAPSPAPMTSTIEPPSSSAPLGPSAPGPATGTLDCITPLANMTDCLSFVTEGNNATAPDPNCCPEVAGLVDSNPICLCQLLSNSSLVESFGIKIDISKALKLPSVCRVSTPPVSTCAAVGYPIPPIASEGPAAGTSPSGAQSPGSLASSPSAGGNDSGALSLSINSVQSLFVGLTFSLLLI